METFGLSISSIIYVGLLVADLVVVCVSIASIMESSSSNNLLEEYGDDTSTEKEREKKNMSLYIFLIAGALTINLLFIIL